MHLKNKRSLLAWNTKHFCHVNSTVVLLEVHTNIREEFYISGFRLLARTMVMY